MCVSHYQAVGCSEVQCAYPAPVSIGRTRKRVLSALDLWLTAVPRAIALGSQQRRLHGATFARCIQHSLCVRKCVVAGPRPDVH